MVIEDIELKKQLLAQSTALQKAGDACIKMVRILNARCLHENVHEGVIKAFSNTRYKWCPDCDKEW